MTTTNDVATRVAERITARVKEFSATIDGTVCVLCEQLVSLDGAGRYPNAQQFKPPASRSVRELGIQ